MVKNSTAKDMIIAVSLAVLFSTITKATAKQLGIVCEYHSRPPYYQKYQAPRALNPALAASNCRVPQKIIKTRTEDYFVKVRPNSHE